MWNALGLTCLLNNWTVLFVIGYDVDDVDWQTTSDLFDKFSVNIEGNIGY